MRKMISSRQTFKMLCVFFSFFLVIFASKAELPQAEQKNTKIATNEQFFDVDILLSDLQEQTYQYFFHCTNPKNGLVMDKALNLPPKEEKVDFSYAAASIAGVGFALTAHPLAVERGWISKQKALELTEVTLSFFLNDMEHRGGFFYHFVDMYTGERAMNCEISSIDTAIFLAGALFAAEYFKNPQIQNLANALYDRVDWQWMCNGGTFPSMGWTPENGFIPATWDHYSEGLLLYILAMAAPKYPLPIESWNYRRFWGEYKGHVYLMNQPLFTHQFPQIWLDLRNKRDEYANYFLSSLQATLANRQFCLDLREAYKTFSENRWGLTACIGPDTYYAYGAPPNPAIVDGTVAPAAAISSIIFTPDLAINALKEYYNEIEFSDGSRHSLRGRFGLADSFNLDRNFIASEAFAINQGSILLMVENYRSGFVWQHFMKIPYVIEAMKILGFKPDESKQNLLNDLKVYQTAAYMPHKRPIYESKPISDDYELSQTSLEDSNWNLNQMMLIDQNYIQTITRPPEVFNYKLYWHLSHNHKSLIFKFELYDTTMTSLHSEHLMYKDDCIEIYFNTKNLPFSWGGEHDYQIILSPDSAQNDLRIKEFLKGDELTSKIKWKYRRLPTGYRAIVEVPREAIGLLDVQLFAASIAAHDIDDSGTVDMKYCWYFPVPESNLAKISLLTERE